jgi:hypothetical protein
VPPLRSPTEDELHDFGTPDFTIYNGGAFPANRYTSYMTSSTSIDVSLKHNEMVGARGGGQRALGRSWAWGRLRSLATCMNPLAAWRPRLTVPATASKPARPSSQALSSVH